MIRAALTALLCSPISCGGDDSRAQSGLDAGATAAMDAGMTGAAKGEACVERDDCAEPSAVCRKGNLCTGPIDSLAYQIECTRDAPESCPGLVCIGLVANLENKTGICSLPCADDAECGDNAACVALSGSQSYCLHTCLTEADCENGFTCVDDPDGRGKACLVTPS